MGTTGGQTRLPWTREVRGLAAVYIAQEINDIAIWSIQGSL